AGHEGCDGKDRIHVSAGLWPERQNEGGQCSADREGVGEKRESYVPAAQFFSHEAEADDSDQEKSARAPHHAPTIEPIIAAVGEMKSRKGRSSTKFGIPPLNRPASAPRDQRAAPTRRLSLVHAEVGRVAIRSKLRRAVAPRGTSNPSASCKRRMSRGARPDQHA